MTLWNKIKADPAWALFLAFAFLCVVSTPLARITMVLSLFFMLSSREKRRFFRMTPATLGWLSYLVLALVISFIMAQTCSDPDLVPKRGLSKITKLLWFAAIPLTAAMASSRERVHSILKAIVLGGMVLGGFILIFHPIIAILQVDYPIVTEPGSIQYAISEWLSDKEWAPWNNRPPAFYYAFTKMGTMHDAQRLMVALLVALCMLFSEKKSGNKRSFDLYLVASLLISVGLIMTCKRAALLIGVGISALILLTQLRLRNVLLILCGVCAVTFAIPSVRTRLADLPNELRAEKGGRVMMWTEIVPELHRQHPYGIGFRALTSKKMLSIAPKVEDNRTHVHSVPLQAFVDFGYLGAIVWCAWFLMAFASAALLFFSAKRFPEYSVAAKAPLFMLLSLGLMGFIEYNIGDAAVVVLYSVAFGLSSPWFLGREDSPRGETAFLEKVFLKSYKKGFKLRGVEIFNLYLLRDLAEQQRPVVLAAHRSWLPVIRKEVKNSAALKVLCVPNGLFPPLTCSFAGCALRLHAALHGRFAKFFVANDVNGLALVIRKCHKRGIFKEMVLLAHKLPSDFFVKSIQEIPGHILSVSSFIEDEFKKQRVIAKTYTDYGIVNGDKFSPAEGKDSSQPVRFCLLGDLTSEWKGADTALAAFELLPPELRAQAELHIQAFSTPREFPPESRIFSHPWSSLDQIPDFLRGMDVMLACSRLHNGLNAETFSQTVVQGMLTALPIIHTSIIPYVEKFDQGGGILADTPEEIARAMTELIQNPERRRSLGQKAREVALERYVWQTERFCERYL